MKSSGRIVALAAFLGASQIAAFGAVAISDNSELFLTASATVTFDDNIFLSGGSNSRVDDTIYKLSPGVDYVFGRNSQTTGNIYYRHDILRYTDRDAQNTDLANFGLNSLYSNGKTKFDFGASFSEMAQNDPFVPGFIVERDVTRFRGLGEIGLSQKTSIGFGLRYENYDYQQTFFRDSHAWTAPLDLYFEYSPKLQISAGYRYRSTNVSGSAADSRDHFFNIGARGEFTPKLVGQVRVGYTTRDYPGSNRDDSRLGADANLTYTFSEKTSVFIGVNNDFGTSPYGDSTEDFAVNVGVSSRMDEQWSWNAQFAFRSTDYPLRSDDYYQASLGAAFRYSENVSFSANYTHRRNNSDSRIPGFEVDFRNNLFSVAANIRY
jgi:hypothetical protein